MNSRVKPRILTSGDKALGLGDAFILTPTLLDLSKNYDVVHIATHQSYNILKYLNNGNSLKILNMDQQGYFYNNDHQRAINLIYWEVRNTLRQFGNHSINVTRQIAGLPIICDSTLPEFPIPEEVDIAVQELFSEFKHPIVVTQPLMSYWTKMVDPSKQVKIIDELLKKDYTVIQIGSSGLPSNILHEKSINLIGKTNIEQSMAMIKNADVFLGCDSFGQHCAAFMKTPAVVMFCGTSPEDFGYPFNSNIFHPEVAFCQYKCGRPVRWLYDYEFSNRDHWNSRSEVGWVCPNKICERAITVDEVVSAVDKEIKLGKNRDWTFYDYKHFGE